MHAYVRGWWGWGEGRGGGCGRVGGGGGLGYVDISVTGKHLY